MSPRSIALLFTSIALVACSSAPPKDDSIPTSPDRETHEKEPAKSDDDLVADPSQGTEPTEPTNTTEPTEPTEPATPAATDAGPSPCVHQCALDTKSCANPTQFKTCVKDANGCRVWSTPKNCVRAVPSPGCYAYQTACFGDCKDGCSTEGNVTCSGPTSYVKCVRNASDQCLKIASGSCQTSTICFADPKVCANGS